MEQQLAEIPVSLHQPRFYFETLWFAIQHSYSGDPELSRVGRQVEEILGYTPVCQERHFQRGALRKLSSVIGWSGSRSLGSLIDREWLVSDSDELEPLAGVLSRCPALASAREIGLYGSGVCGLAGLLAEKDYVERVHCSDLSFLGLFLGRLLIEAEYRQLPERFIQARTCLEVGDPPDRFIEGVRDRRFRQILPSVRGKLSYRVLDVFTLLRLPDSELILFPYLLDVFQSHQLVTALIRICERIKMGRTAIFVVTASVGRDPRVLLASLQECGLEVDFLGWERLPYSLSRFGYDFVESVFPTLIAQVTRVSPVERQNFRLKCHLRQLDEASLSRLLGDSEPEWRRQRPINLTSRQRSSLLRYCHTGAYGEVCQALQGELGESLSDEVIAYLASRGAIQLSTPQLGKTLLRYGGD